MSLRDDTEADLAPHTLPVILLALFVVVGLLLVAGFCILHGAPVTLPPTPVPPKPCSLPVSC